MATTKANFHPWRWKVGLRFTAVGPTDNGTLRNEFSSVLGIVSVDQQGVAPTRQ